MMHSSVFTSGAYKKMRVCRSLTNRESQRLTEVWQEAFGVCDDEPPFTEEYAIVASGLDGFCTFDVRRQQGVYALWVHNLCVASRKRRLGVGTCILKKAEQVAEIRGVEYVAVNVNDDNETLFNFYTHAGFSAASVRRGMRVMVKKINREI